jgi:ferredoxin-NADP reductase
MNHEVKILNKHSLNHDVVQFRLERPRGYQFSAGQATELSLKEPVSKGPGPFTFTGLTTSPDLELIIKIYEQHNGLTAALAKLKPGDRVVITEPWDSFKNEGPGVFIAGGAGITPLIALLRQMRTDGNISESQLFFSNKTQSDVFLHEGLTDILGDRYVDVITRDDSGRSTHVIDEALLRKNVIDRTQPFYVCGPPGFVESVQTTLKNIGVSGKMVKISL